MVVEGIYGIVRANMQDPAWVSAVLEKGEGNLRDKRGKGQNGGRLREEESRSYEGMRLCDADVLRPSWATGGLRSV